MPRKTVLAILLCLSPPAFAQQPLQFIAADNVTPPGSALTWDSDRQRPASQTPTGDIVFGFALGRGNPAIWRLNQEGLQLLAGPPDATTGLTRLVDADLTGRDHESEVTTDGTVYARTAVDTRAGLWRFIEAEPALDIAVIGEAAPMGTWVRIANFRATDRGLFFEATDGGGEGLFLFNGTSVQAILRVGGASPEAGFDLDNLIDYETNRRGTVAVSARLTDGVSFRSAMLVDGGSGWQTVLAVDPPVEGEVAAFTDRLAVSQDDVVVALGAYHHFDMVTMGFTNREALVQVANGTASALIRSGEAVGNLFYDGLDIANFAPGGGVAMTAGLRDAGGAARLKSIVLQTTDFQVLATVGDTAPGGGTYTNFTDFWVGPLGERAWTAHVDGANTLFVGDASGTTRRVIGAGDMVDIGNGTMKTLSGVQLHGANFRSPFSDSGRLCVGLAWPGAGGIACTAPPMPQPVDLVGLEAVQVVQDWKNSVELVEGKRTFVRAHFNSATPLLLQVQLRARRNGQELPGSPLPAGNLDGRHVVYPTIGNLRSYLDGGAFFIIPLSWSSDTVEFEVEAVQGNINLTCKEVAGPTANDCKLTRPFNPVPTMPVRMLAVAWEKDNMERVPTRFDLAKLTRRVLSSFPQSRLQWRATEMPYKGDLSVSGSDSKLLRAIKLFRFASGCGASCNEIFYGATRGASFGGLGDFPGFASLGEIVDAPRYGYLRQTHELGHNIHLDHVPYCGAVADEPPPMIPNVGTYGGRDVPLIGPFEPEDDRIFGVDQQTLEIIDQFSFDVMGYCTARGFHRWPSKFTYEKMLSEVRARFTPPPPSSPQVSLMVFTGTVSSNDASIDPLTQVVTSAQLESAVGPYTLIAKNAAGTEVTQLAFSSQTIMRDAPGPGGGEHFAQQTYLVALAPDPAIRSIEIRRDGILLATRSASANPPTVMLLAPNGGEDLGQDTLTVQWSGSDIDGDRLTYRLEYSADDGASWVAVGFETQDTEMTISRRLLEPSANGRLRVYGSDGFDIAQDESDGAFTVQNHAPEVVLMSPQEQQIFYGDQTIIFDAAPIVTDSDTATVSWSSNLNGSLGSETDFLRSASELAEGTHTLTVTARDPQGAEGSDSVMITVVRQVPADLADLTVSVLDAQPNVIAPQGSVRFDVQVANLGPALVGTNVVLSIELPQQLAFMSATNASATCNGPTCTWTELTQPEVVHVVATGVMEGAADVAFGVTADGTDPKPANNRVEFAIAVDNNAPPPFDAGTPDVDGGTDGGVGDGGPSGIDAGVMMDEGEGCGCSSSNSQAPWGFCLIFLPVLALRRRR